MTTKPFQIARAALAALAFATFAGVPALAQEAAAEPPVAESIGALDAQLRAIVSEARDTGLGVAVIENGAVVHVAGYGLADRAAGTPVTPDTVFRAGSISKTFVALTILQLAGEGKLSLDTRLAEIAPDITFRNPWEETDPIRIVHLLEHTTGWSDLTFGDYAHGIDGEALDIPVRLNAPHRTSRYRPGLFFSYANQGYGILGLLVERLDGRSFEDSVRDRVLTPLGMSDSDFALPESLRARLAKSYAGALLEEQTYKVIGMRPAGHLHTTARDLAKLVQMFVTGGSERVVREAGIDRMQRSETSLHGRSGAFGAVGLGLFGNPSKTHVFYGHDGGIDGFNASFAYLPGTGRGFVVLSNAATPARAKATAAIEAYLTRDLPVTLPPQHSLSPEQSERISGFYGVVPGRNPVARFLEAVTVLWADVTDDGLVSIAGEELVPVSDTLFRTKTRPEPVVAAVTAENGLHIVSSSGNLRKMPLHEVTGVFALLIVITAALLMALVYFPIWLIVALRGGLQQRGGVLLRLAPFLGAASFVALVVILFRFLNGPTGTLIDTLGTPGPVPYAMAALSVTVPLMAVLSLLLGVTTRGANGWGRFQALFIGVALAWLSVTMATTGWLPMLVWRL